MDLAAIGRMNLATVGRAIDAVSRRPVAAAGGAGGGRGGDGVGGIGIEGTLPPGIIHPGRIGTGQLAQWIDEQVVRDQAIEARALAQQWGRDDLGITPEMKLMAARMLGERGFTEEAFELANDCSACLWAAKPGAPEVAQFVNFAVSHGVQAGWSAAQLGAQDRKSVV